MAARAYWKGYLKLSLVSCPIALFPATSEREKISFHQFNKETGNRIRYCKVDAETGDEVPQENIIKGYEVEQGRVHRARPGRASCARHRRQPSSRAGAECATLRRALKLPRTLRFYAHNRPL